MYCLSVPLGFCLSRSKIEMPWLFIEHLSLSFDAVGDSLPLSPLRGQSL